MTLPPERRAHVSNEAVLRIVASWMPLTVTGRLLFVFVRLPSWPHDPPPGLWHLTVPLPSSAQPWSATTPSMLQR
ncbi:hypothetical protein [Candidatus Solirubrobacter pratensis]|uniref:hypothetical protein n=1 Tax=Candidatus Solirubrobacter pratensis TaxID=1298857 RepID=UPI0004833E06|nr:hypothetical protein [Candidatus Solirubrobacter pratensis]